MSGCPDSAVLQLTFAAVGALVVGVALAYLAVRALGTRGSPRPRRVRRVLLGGLALLLATPLCGAGGYLLWYTHRPLPSPVDEPLFEHVRYRREVHHRPRPLVLHLASVDLGQPGVRLLVTAGRRGSRQLRGLRTSSFLRRHRLQLAINGQIFYPWRSGLLDYYPHVGDPVNVVGLNAAAGAIYARPTPKHPTLFIGRDRRARIGWRRPGEPVHQAISGTRMLVEDGKITSDLYRPQDRVCQPRTAVGLDRDARLLLLLVVDGRQPNYSEGVPLAELARLLVERGAHDAINLDGGGSSILVAEGDDGTPRVLSSPIDRRLPGRERVVANHLGVFAPPLRR